MKSGHVFVAQLPCWPAAILGSALHALEARAVHVLGDAPVALPDGVTLHRHAATHAADGTLWPGGLYPAMQRLAHLPLDAALIPVGLPSPSGLFSLSQSTGEAAWTLERDLARWVLVDPRLPLVPDAPALPASQCVQLLTATGETPVPSVPNTVPPDWTGEALAAHIDDGACLHVADPSLAKALVPHLKSHRRLRMLAPLLPASLAAPARAPIFDMDQGAWTAGSMSPVGAAALAEDARLSLQGFEAIYHPASLARRAQLTVVAPIRAMDQDGRFVLDGAGLEEAATHDAVRAAVTGYQGRVLAILSDPDAQLVERLPPDGLVLGHEVPMILLHPDGQEDWRAAPPDLRRRRIRELGGG